MGKIREINRRNAKLAKMNDGDEKFVRIHNRTTEKGLISKRETEVCGVLSELKKSIDDQVLLNNAILQNDPYFEGAVKRLVGKGLQELNVKADLPDKYFIADLIAQQYLNQYYLHEPSKIYEMPSIQMSMVADSVSTNYMTKKQ